MFRTTYTGKVEMLGSGRFQSNWFVRRSLIKITDQRLKNVVASDELDDFLESGVENNDQVKMSVGWVMFYRWLLSVNHGGETLRQGIILLVIGLVTHMAVTLLSGLLIGGIVGSTISYTLGTLLGIGIAGFGLLTCVLNLKAWMAPGF